MRLLIALLRLLGRAVGELLAAFPRGVGEGWRVLFPRCQHLWRRKYVYQAMVVDGQGRNLYDKSWVKAECQHCGKQRSFVWTAYNEVPNTEEEVPPWKMETGKEAASCGSDCSG